MSTKSAKKSASQAAASSTNSQQPSTSTPISRGNRPASPLSPTRMSRLQEKQDLQNLNDRLACYIDRVRHLENENSRLSRQVETSQDIVTREVTNIKNMYEHELSDARKLLDETARERAKLEIDTKRLWDDNEDLKNKLDKTLKDLQIAERNLLLYETRCTDLQSQFNQSQAERKKMAERERTLEKELEKLKGLHEETRKHLEEETLQRIDLENHVQSLKEDISFKDQVYQQELSESRNKRQVEISEIDGRLAEQYEAKLQQSLQELRDQYEAQMRANREEIEGLYENKIKNLTQHAQRNVGATNLAVEDLRQARARIDALNQKINDLEAEITAANGKMREAENQREIEKIKQAENMAILENELSQMREDMSHQLQEYQDLMDIRVALDLEIAAYRKLLESEEARLNIVPMQSSMVVSGSRATPSRQTPMRQGKRKRQILDESDDFGVVDFDVTSTTKCEIKISDAEPTGQFVKLTNEGAKEVSLSGWQIIRKAGTLETNFKFHRTAKVEPGATITVWSSDVGAVHEPPLNVVMKGQKWFVGDNMTTALLNSDGEEVAISERKKQMSSTLRRHRESLYRIQEDLHHQQGDPTTAERCRLM